MSTKRLIVIAGLIACMSGIGCHARMVSEGIGLVQGASGKVSEMQASPHLATYRGIRIESITFSPGLNAPSEVLTFLNQAYLEKAADLRLTVEGSPALVVTGEVIHFEQDGVLDKTISPLQEIVVRTQLRDADSGAALGEANLVGRAKTVSAGGTENLCEGVGRALKKWLRQHGLAAKDEKPWEMIDL